MNVQLRWSTWALGLLLVSTLSASGCKQPRKVETKPAANPEEHHEKAGTNQGRTAPDAQIARPAPDTAGAEPVDVVAPFEDMVQEPTPEPPQPLPEEELRSKLKQLKFRARREVVATRATIENVPSYQRALEKFEREFEQWKMFTAIPVEPEFDRLKATIQELTDRLKIDILYYNEVLPGDPAQPMPEFIYGDKSYEFKDEDIVRIAQVTIKVPQIDSALLRELVTELKNLDRLLLIRRIKAAPEGFLVNMSTFYWGPEKYPLHKAEPRDLERRLQAMGVTDSLDSLMKLDPVGYLQNAALSYKEINTSLPKLNEALALLSRSKFLEARSAFFRRTMEQAAEPTPIP